MPSATAQMCRPTKNASSLPWRTRPTCVAAPAVMLIMCAPNEKDRLTLASGRAPDPCGIVARPCPGRRRPSARVDRYPDAFAASRAGVALALSATETKLLIELESTVGRVTRRELLTRVWNDGYAGDSRLVDAAVQRLRAKIEPVPADPTYIQTVRGTGYRMDRS
ncbi:winged helix family transcriptional regulator [Propioniciclava tarda]|uniref:Winged helix family transcriptional regulator n=1 Tax=Propioniciclava tarda TaxID=433330 RepID=A0A4V2JSY6_PROTD|nr:winged helix family transcriptional regulator [Propioniciclava tarda]